MDVHRYPRRGREQKTYHEEEISDDDDYLCKKHNSSIIRICSQDDGYMYLLVMEIPTSSDFIYMYHNNGG